MKAIVLHVEDIALKKGNRPFFFKHLVGSIKQRLSEIGPFRVFVKDNRVFLMADHEEMLEDAFLFSPFFLGSALSRKALIVPPNIPSIDASALLLAEGLRFDSFKVETRRSSKDHPFTSPEVNAIVGASIQAKTQARVDLKKPERVFWVDVLKEEALVSTDQLKGFGGLPPGSSGRALVLFSGGIDSPVAAFLAMQRGLKVDLIHFSAFPYVRYVNEEKHRWLAQRLALFQGKTRLYRVGIGRVQQMIAAHTPKKLLVVLNRRLMLRLASEIGRRNGYGALITGDSLGQVASQTLENLTVIDHASPMMTLRPLIGLGKQAIVGLAKQIETFSLSIQPDEDCCQLFVPKHPETRANLEKVLSVESHLSLKDWEKEALDGLKHEEVFPPIKSVISSYEAFYPKKPSWLQGSVS